MRTILWDLRDLRSSRVAGKRRHADSECRVMCAQFLSDQRVKYNNMTLYNISSRVRIRNLW